ncbi:uncharacterized protein EI90DRAFT_1757725 [Cantharellus anzutake]|uniref:uncharacterized protein n=1 Tax=Cantharellus anzutake TaxID=1750568 RepID=UPI00190729DF|nr:uncharacterized protein EI90DRAFT_1757725 [Cantharellus anzutake]KAF8341574.1 hypothetical protein EI90DRAFT_1757725 [Cantharellus anzutake]
MDVAEEKQSWRSVTSGQAARIDRFPDEILLYVFLLSPGHLVESLPMQNLCRFRQSVSTTCRRWRAIALRISKYYPTMAEVFLSRSRFAPLRIRLQTGTCCDRSKVQDWITWTDVIT